MKVSQVVDENTTRRCYNCFQTKPLSEFYRKGRRPPPLRLADFQARCKGCNAEVVRGYNQRKRYKESRAHHEMF